MGSARQRMRRWWVSGFPDDPLMMILREWLLVKEKPRWDLGDDEENW